MDVDTDVDKNLQDHLDDLVTASKIPAKRRGLPVKPTVEKLTSLLYQDGILPDELIRLVDLISTPNHLDQASLSALIRNLYPASNVVDNVVLSIVGSLGVGQLKPSLTIQSLLLRWLIMVYPVLQTREVLSRCYSVLFNLLDTAAIRLQLCHILALTTRRKHVRPYRIQFIMDLSRQTGHDPSLVGLLRIYKNYYPEVIVGDATRGKASPFKYPDPEWRQRLDRIRAAHRLRQVQLTVDRGARNGFSVIHEPGFGKPHSLVPTVQTSHANEASVTLDEIDNASQFVKNLEKIELPNQLVAVMADPLLQKLLLLRPDPGAAARITDWLEACVADAEESAYVDGGSALLDLLEIVRDHAYQTRTLHPIFDSLLDKLYPVWNGMDRKDVVSAVLTYLPLQPFQQLYKSHLKPFEDKTAEEGAGYQMDLLRFYESLLQRWAISVLSQDAEISPETERREIFGEFIGHVDRLCLSLMQRGTTVTMQLRILSFYDQVARLFCEPELMGSIPIAAPAPVIIYTLALTDSAALFSGLCEVLARYKRGLEAAMAANRPKVTRQERDQVAVFNSFFMDICNLVWRGRALEKQADTARGCGLADAVIAALEDWAAGQEGGDRKALRLSYGISRAPVLCLFAADFFRDLENEELDGAIAAAAAALDEDGAQPPILVRHAGPVSQQSLAQLARDGGLDVSWQEYRLGVLDELATMSLGGLRTFLFQAIKTLSQRGGVTSQQPPR